jgi:hypothetical protein
MFYVSIKASVPVEEETCPVPILPVMTPGTVLRKS